MSLRLPDMQIRGAFPSKDLQCHPSAVSPRADLLTDQELVCFRIREIGTAAFPEFTIRAGTSEHHREPVLSSIEGMLANS